MKVMPPTDFRTSRSNGQCVVKLLMRYLSIALIISPIASSLRIVPLSSHKVCNQHSLSRVGVIKQQRPPLVLVVRYNELYQSVTTRRARGTNVESLMSTNNNLGSFKRRVVEDRRSFFSSLLLGSLITFPISSLEAFGATDNDAGGVQVKLSGEAKKVIHVKLFYLLFLQKGLYADIYL